MNLYPMGDYYAWYCDWCDTKNLTIWTRADEGKVTCGACQKRSPVTGTESEDQSNEALMACC